MVDLTRFLAVIESREDKARRPVIDPRILVTLWLYATSEGVASARELARLCGMHDAYRWICGGVDRKPMNYDPENVSNGRPEACGVGPSGAPRLPQFFTSASRARRMG